MTKERRVNTGTVGIVVRDDGRILVGQRFGSHGEGTWTAPGGWMRHGETPEMTVDREVFEETGITIRRPRAFAFTSDFFSDEDVHSTTIWVVADWWNGEPIARESKLRNVRWVSVDALPHPLFLPFHSLGVDTLARVVYERVSEIRTSRTC